MMAEKPINVDVVGAAVVEAIDDETISGVLNLKNIEALANKGWRKTML